MPQERPRNIYFAFYYVDKGSHFRPAFFSDICDVCVQIDDVLVFLYIVTNMSLSIAQNRTDLPSWWDAVKKTPSTHTSACNIAGIYDADSSTLKGAKVDIVTDETKGTYVVCFAFHQLFFVPSTYLLLCRLLDPPQNAFRRTTLRGHCRVLFLVVFPTHLAHAQFRHYGVNQGTHDRSVLVIVILVCQ